MTDPKNIAILASGSGSNAEKIIHYFKNHKAINIACVITNNENAGAIERAEKAHVPSKYFSKEDFEHPSFLLQYLKSKEVDYIVLAGFLLKIAPDIVAQYPDKIINIHPALLPKYGGKGMYGNHVHESVILNKETESGITIHIVNENYDEGRIIFQAKCDISPQMGAKQLSAKVQQLEHQHFPKIIEEFVENN
ncbi:phosphoribosylglycinamide formyltransferase-1 [Marivirga sericea]|uniref:Phosphoribosylglycinamide formyltransferase n=1 Tax=Marivirga sericea TaxID=1028 RepID=A0A1X7KST0_9BACT|nr:phosphoribosylglycinamide formyltransferase [Marivirga sericea]SMG44269.1 phosphoribosylglycinamide formyltransferase-1 [Marivirga sericea]